MSSIRFLRTFVAVARTGSFSAASQRVALTPTAVSLQMRTLETDLGYELFDRSGKIVALNARGYRLLPKIESLLEQYESLRHDDDGRQEVVGEISVGAIATSMAVLARTVLQLRVSHPKLQIHLATNYSGNLSMRVQHQELDAVLSTKSPHRVPAGVIWTPLYIEPFVFVASRNAVKGKSIRGLLRERLFLRVARTIHTGALIDGFMRRQRMEVNDFLEMNTLRTITELVRQDVGVTIVPLQRDAVWKDDPRLFVHEFDELGAHRRIGLFESERRSHLTSIVRNSLLEEFGRNRQEASDD